MRGRLFAAGLVVNALLCLTALGWLAWITFEPRYWFPDAFAEKGERGERGPRGEQGPRGAIGPRGPVGPSVREAIEAVEADIGDLEGRIADLESAVGVSELQSQVDELGSELEDVASIVDNICSELLLSDVEPLNDLYYGAC
jgi:hypothetical protein